MTGHDQAELLASLTAELAGPQGQQVTTQLIVDRALDMSVDADHVSLTIRSAKGYETLASTSDAARWCDQLQYDLDQGPCVDSAARGDWFRSGNLDGDPRWPDWAPRAAARGVRSFLSVRLLSHGRPFGALNLYADELGRFDDRDDVELMLLYTAHAASALTAARLVENLETAMSSRHQIGVAQGILIARYGLTVTSSFEALRRISQHTNRKVRDVAADVIESRGLPLEEDSSEQSSA